MSTTAPAPRFTRADAAFLVAFALFKAVLHLATNGRYGIFRDELYYFDCATHLDWGYVDHPPLSIAVLAATRALLGDGVWAIRLTVVLAGAASVFLMGYLVQQMGGRRFAQAVACIALIIAPVLLVFGGFYSMNVFDLLLWIAAACVLVRIVNTGNPQLWLLFGLVCGLGLQNKLSMLFFGVALVPALALTPLRSHFRQWQLYAGGALAGLIFLPHVLWQVAHDWPTLAFIRNATEHKNIDVGAVGFATEQILLLHPLLLPLWVSGLFYGLFATSARRYRVFAWIFLFVFVFLALNNSKSYYLAAASPLVYALGALGLERLVGPRARLQGVVLAVIVVGGLITLPLGVPVLSAEQLIRYQVALGLKAPQMENNAGSDALDQHFADRFGWKELTDAVATAYDGLSEEEQAQCAILAQNYGEAGAINYFGRAHGLPRALSGHNSHALWGPGDATGAVVIVIDSPNAREELAALFTHVTPGPENPSHPYAMNFERNRVLYICRGLKEPIAELWPRLCFYI